MRGRLYLEFQGTEEEYRKLKRYLQQDTFTINIFNEEVEEKIIQFHDLIIDIERREVLLKQKKVSLTAREFDILSYFANHPGTAFSHRQIYEAVWNREFCKDAANITAHIGHIRKKIETNPKSPVYIQTVHGVGYKFMEKGETEK